MEWPASQFKLTVPAKVGDGVHLGREGHLRRGPVENSEGAKVRVPRESHTRFGLASSDPVPVQAGRCGSKNGMRASIAMARIATPFLMSANNDLSNANANKHLWVRDFVHCNHAD